MLKCLRNINVYFLVNILNKYINTLDTQYKIVKSFYADIFLKIIEILLILLVNFLKI